MVVIMLVKIYIVRCENYSGESEQFITNHKVISKLLKVIISGCIPKLCLAMWEDQYWRKNIQFTASFRELMKHYGHLLKHLGILNQERM